jgi:hypothetical protein
VVLIGDLKVVTAKGSLERGLQGVATLSVAKVVITLVAGEKIYE